jgi:hypothetical protein
MNIRKLNEQYLRSQFPDFYARLDEMDGFTKELGRINRQARLQKEEKLTDADTADFQRAIMRVVKSNSSYRVLPEGT